MNLFEWCFVLPDGDALRWWKTPTVPAVGDIVRLESRGYKNEGPRDEQVFRVRAREWERRLVFGQQDWVPQLKLYIHLEEPTDDDT